MAAVADVPVDSVPRVVRVMVESPLPQLDRLFDYAVPERLRDQIAPGIRVKVPLRSAGRIADGYITTSGKDPALYTDTLLPALREGLAKAGRPDDAIDTLQAEGTLAQISEKYFGEDVSAE